jgi:PDZ-binding kinase
MLSTTCTRRNILVIGDFEDIKICDFGVSLPLEKKTLNVTKESVNDYVGTGPWSAKEVIDGESPISHKTDIFALGCVIFEMLALEAPHVAKLAKAGDDDSDEASSDESDYDESEYEDALGTRPELPDDISDLGAEYEKVLSLFYACTEENPDKRPSAKKILDILNL